MRRILQLVSLIALVSTVLPAVLLLGGSLELEQVKSVMLLATIAWFIATPLWMGQPTEIQHEEVVP